MKVQSYLSFEGRCEEALAFYQKALGAEVLMKMRFKESPDPCPEGMIPPGSEQKIMHSSFRIGDTELMATDGNCSGKPSFEGISLALTPRDEAAAQKVFGALSEGGTVEMSLGKTFFSPAFGMVKDRFGVHWMVVVDGNGQ